MQFLTQYNYDTYYSWGLDMQSDTILPTWETPDICIIPGTYWKFQNFKQYDLALVGCSGIVVSYPQFEVSGFSLHIIDLLQ